MLEPPIGLEPIPDSFEANRSSVKLRGPEYCRFLIADCRFRSVSRDQSAIGNWQLEMSLVGEDRIELTPRVPKTRMLTLHHTPLQNRELSERDRESTKLSDCL